MRPTGGTDCGLWPTMRYADGATGKVKIPPKTVRGRIEEVVAGTIHRSRSGQTPTGSLEPTEGLGGLNPEFVCWMVGYPDGWWL
jgi:hypothetical protein